MHRTHGFIFIGLLLLSASSWAMDSLWWTETSPHAGHGSGQHAHGGPVEIRRGVYHKNLWLRTGTGPTVAEYTNAPVNSRLLLVNVSGESTEVSGGDLHGSFGVNFAMPMEGFYNLYLIGEVQTDNGREIHVAKAEALKHSCREGHDHVKDLMAPRPSSAVPLELVRERVSQENFHTLLGFGDTVEYLVLQHGRPLTGAEVTLHTAQGWSNAVRSDANGHARFTLIRDYYPPWHEFERRHRQEYVVHASHISSDGDSGRTRFSTTLNGSYYPSSRDYRSYAYGLLLGVFALTFSGVAVYLYRRRRQHRFHEVRFDEKN